MSRYTLKNPNAGTLPAHCERIAEYWSGLVCFDVHASGKALGQRFKAAWAFKTGLRAGGLGEIEIARAYLDTIEIARLKAQAD